MGLFLQCEFDYQGVLGEDVKQVWKEEKAKKLKNHLKKLLKMNIMMMSGLFMIYKPLYALVYFR